MGIFEYLLAKRAAERLKAYAKNYYEEKDKIQDILP